MIHPKVAQCCRKVLLGCGIAAALLYVGTDLISSSLYVGFNLRDQAVSELFAIGAPTSRLVVPLFTLSSALLLAFAAGIALSAGGQKALLLMAAMFAASAVVGLFLWNLFPMHIRGAERSFTDTMHLILATNPFVWVTLAIGLIAFRGGFRSASALAIVMVVMPALFAFRYAPALDAGQSTPGLGLSERIAQYSYQVWQIVLALVLLRGGQAAQRRTKHP